MTDLHPTHANVPTNDLSAGGWVRMCANDCSFLLSSACIMCVPDWKGTVDDASCVLDWGGCNGATVRGGHGDSIL